jgi:autotransporter translocation and assembly factor TamB
MNRILKITMYVLGALFALLVLLGILLRLGHLNAFVVTMLNSQVSKNINGELSIESLQGNLYSDFTLENIYLVQNNDTLLSCRTINVDYHIWSLLHQQLEVNKLQMSLLQLNVSQEKDSTYNLANILEVGENTDTVTNKSGWDIMIKDFNLSHFTSNIKLLGDNAFVPSYVESDFRSSLLFSGEEFEIDLKHLRVATQKPEFNVVNLSGKFSGTLYSFSWKDISLQLNKSLAKSEGRLVWNEPEEITAAVHMEPLDFSDFRALLPDLKLYGNPEVQLSLRGDSGKYTMSALIMQAKQKIQLTGVVSDLNKVPHYVANLSLEAVDAAYWTNEPNQQLKLSGHLQLQGKGFDKLESEMTLKGSFQELRYNLYHFRNLNINSTKMKERLNGVLSTQASFGDFWLNYDVTKILSQPQYHLKARYRNLNLQNVPGIDSLYTLLNGDISIDGTGESLDNLMVDLLVHSNHSTLMDYPIDDFKIQAYYRKGDYKFSGLNFETPYFSLIAEGKGNINLNNDIYFDFESRDITPLLTKFNLPPIELQATLNGRVRGKRNDLITDVNLDLDHATYDSMKIGDSHAHIFLEISDDKYQGEATLNTSDIQYGSFNIKELAVSGDFANHLINTHIQLQVNDSLFASFGGRLENFENPLLWVNELGLNYNGEQWNSHRDSTYIKLNTSDVYVHDFHLHSGNQEISVQGVFSFDGENNMAVNIQDLDLSRMPLHSYSPYRVSGRLSSSAHLTGTANKPIIQTKLSIDQARINDYKINQISNNLYYEDEQLSYSGNIMSNIGHPIQTSFNIPLHLSFKDSIYVLRDSPLFSASLHLDSLDLNALSRIYPIEDVVIKGFSFADVKVSNTINNPVINGHLKLANGEIENTGLGVYYRDIDLSATFNKSLITLNGLSVKSNKKGKLTMEGYMNIDSGLPSDADVLNIMIKATNFKALESTKMDLNMDADMKMSGSGQHPLLNGQIILNRSLVNADYFNTYLNQKTDDPNPPLLLKAMEEEQVEIRTTDTLQARPILSSSAIYKNMRGTIVLKIPSNTWVRGKDMNFELNGSLQFIKNTEDINIVGTLYVSKGSYKMYGRNFNITEGELTFTGGKELNPNVNFTILYKFRDIEKELRTLQIELTGTMLQPEMEFVLDDDDIDEKDAISYIVFKKSSDQLSDSQKSKVFSGDDLAMGLVLDQLSSVVKESLKQSTGIDVIEISGEDNWKVSNVTLGKYITNKLYLSYEQVFLLDKKTKTVNTEKMMLEYQFLRNVILKATNQNSNSGFDLMFKKKWK